MSLSDVLGSVAMSTEMAQPYEHPPKKLYRVASRWKRQQRVYYRYYWDLEKGAKRHGISRYENPDREQWIEEADIGGFRRIEG